MRHFSVFPKLLIFALVMASCASTSPIQKYGESKSNFNNPPELMSNKYPADDIYRIYHHASSGFTSIQSLRTDAELRADDFAKRQGKSFVVLGERISKPPYLLGNFPRIEIVFALIDKSKDPANLDTKNDRLSNLEKLKKLLDDGAVTKEEYEKEKKKILEGNE